MISIDNGAILVKTGSYDGLIQVEMLDLISGRGRLVKKQQEFKKIF